MPPGIAGAVLRLATGTVRAVRVLVWCYASNI